MSSIFTFSKILMLTIIVLEKYGKQDTECLYMEI